MLTSPTSSFTLASTPPISIYSPELAPAWPSPLFNLVRAAMSASSSSSLPVPADWLLPLMACPLCSDEVVTAFARTSNQAGHRFWLMIEIFSSPLAGPSVTFL